jgi:hypothetical protein
MMEPLDQDRRPGAQSAPERLAHGVQTRSFQVLGFDFAVRSTDPALGRYLDHILGHLAFPGTPEHLYSFEDHGPDKQPRIVVSLDGIRLRAVSDPSLGLGHLLWDLNRRVVEKASPQHLLLHAAAAERDGRVVMLPGPSESGKTTLVAGLVHAGLSYVTDEAVAFDLDDVLVRPYPKPLDVDAGSWPVLAHLAPPPDLELAPYLTDQWHLAPSSVGTGIVASPAPVRLIIAPTYRRGATTTLIPMSRSEAVVVMAEQAFNFRQHGALALATLAALVRSCQCYRMSVGDLDQACVLVLEALDDPAPVFSRGALS